MKGNLGLYEAATLGVEMGTLDAIIARLKVFTILAKSLLSHLILFASSNDFNKNIKGPNPHPQLSNYQNKIVLMICKMILNANNLFLKCIA